jgi:leucyl aminopeptidase
MCAEFSNYRYTHTRKPNKNLSLLKQLDVMGMRDDSRHQRAVQQGLAIAAGMNTARNLGDLPGNICTPEYLAERAQELASALPGLKAKILNEKKIRELKMGALLSVSKGSIEAPYVAILEYYGASRSNKPIALVGKGVCFDTGGISIKPSSAMDEMKYDMCGAASVIGTLETVARLKLPINVIGIVGAVENMPSDRATKPGDVVSSMSGKTIEVLNTDAEGRMVLCDLLHYVKRYEPECIVDIATLTGACLVALGKHAAGLYSNKQKLAERLLKAGTDTTDRAWQLPLWPEYRKELRSNFADIANIGGRYAGSVTAACFLYDFVGDKWNWAHLDIAGVAWHSGTNKGGTGRPVPLLSQFLIDYLDSQGTGAG